MSEIKQSWKLLLSLFLLTALMHASYAQQRPNIIVIISDDHAYQAISAYGAKQVRTPNIDRIAREGVLFNKAYVTNSICGPSRAVFLTGKYSHKNGFKDNEHSRFNGDQHSFIKELKQHGYQTAWIGKWHLETKPQGFDFWQVLPGQGSYYNPDFIMMDSSVKRIEGYATTITEDLAEDWLAQRDRSKPFCLVVGHKATHRTWIPDTSDFGSFDSVNFDLPKNFYDNYSGREAARVQDMTIDKTMLLGYDLKMLSYSKAMEPAVSRMNPAQRAKFDAYYGPIEAFLKAANLSGRRLVEWKYQRYMRDYMSTSQSLDRNIGRLLKYLDANELAKNTLIIYMSDQGFYLGEHGWFDKRFMYEESFRTPMVMRFPGKVQPGIVSNDFVMNVDLGPTLLDAAGISTPAEMQGRSFLPLVTKRSTSARKAMYYHYYENGEHAVSPHFGIRTERYKLIRFYKRVEAWELYDLQKDPSEMHNLFGKKGYQKLTENLKGQLRKLIAKYEDSEAVLVLSTDPGRIK